MQNEKEKRKIFKIVNVCFAANKGKQAMTIHFSSFFFADFFYSIISWENICCRCSLKEQLKLGKENPIWKREKYDFFFKGISSSKRYNSIQLKNVEQIERENSIDRKWHKIESMWQA